MAVIKRYCKDAFRKFQTAAIDKGKRGGEMQTEILLAARELKGGNFVAWLENKIRQCARADDIIVGDVEPPIPAEPEKYSVRDFLQPSAETSAKMWDAWQTLTPGIACSPWTWGYIVARLIIAEKITPADLTASTNGADTRGEVLIDKALNATGDDRAKKMDNRVRALLRRWSGLLERGARTASQNCPPARAWWQHHIARQAAENIGSQKDAVMALLKTPFVWELMSDKIASRLTVIGDRNLRDGITMFLLDDKGVRFRKSKDNLNPLLTDIGVMSAWRSLGYFKPARVKKILAEEIAPHISTDIVESQQ